MSNSLRASAVGTEDRRLDRLPERASGAVQKVDLPLETAKAGVGRAVKAAIGDDPLRVYGDESMMGKVISGEKVPDYMARIYKNADAKRRYALSLLQSDPHVRIRTTVDWEEEKVG